METLFLMIGAHFLCDYPLQGDWLSKAKNHKLQLVPGETIWPLALFGHAAIHGCAVGIITGNVWLGVGETLLHTGIDHAKCAGGINYNQDQWLHIACKLAWFCLFFGPEVT